MIALPPEQFDVFISAAGQKFASVLHATIVQQALVYAICKIQDNLQYHWADVISQYIDSYDDENMPTWEEIVDDINILSIEQVFTIANDMLRDPVKRALKNIQFVHEELESINE